MSRVEGAQRLRTAAGRVAARRRYLPLLSRPSPVAYVGWVGESNVGDEAMFDAHRLLFPDLAFVPVPNLPPNAALRALSRARRPLVRAVCIGGGTLIGNGHFRETFEAFVDVQPDVPRFLLGTGVESDRFLSGSRATVRREIDRWKPILEALQPVGVRGPVSVGILRELGIEAEVVGDPALLLRPPAGTGSGTDAVLGLNVASIDELWGDDPDGVFRTLRTIGRHALGRGDRVVVIEASEADAAVSRVLAEAIGPGVPVVAGHEPEAFLASVARCHVLVAERLHAVILGAAAGVPAVSLEYRPKALDFQASIGRERYNVRTDSLDATALLGLVDELWDDRDRHSKEIGVRVDDLRARLTAGAAAIAADLDELTAP